LAGGAGGSIGALATELSRLDRRVAALAGPLGAFRLGGRTVPFFP
jgi:hypothetical protein